MHWAAAMTDAAALLQCEHLSFRYDRKRPPVFTDLSLAVYPGETVLLMGPSGCGKSSLAYCLAGLYPAYAGTLEGTVLVAGTPITDCPPAMRSRLVSILFQNPDNQFCMDRADHEILFALENINYPGDLRQRTAELLDLVGLRDVAEKPIYTLSGGTKQKLALATALATGAKLLILDEPFANLDPDSCAQVAACLQKLNQQGLTILVVDHRPEYWQPFLSRVILMDRDGTLLAKSILPGEMLSHREEFSRRGLFLDDSWLRSHHPPQICADAPAAMTVRDLALYHDKKLFLSGLSFTLPKGSVTALVGRNGSGKSTLLHALAGVGRYKGTLQAQGRIGLVFQNPRFQFLTLTVLEEVTATLRVIHPKESEEWLADKARSLLEEFSMLEYASVSPYSLSQGQQRRLAILSMLAGDRPILLLDEPTYAQDERATQFILNLLDKRVSQGLTAVIATHDLALAQSCANQTLLLEDGVLRALNQDELNTYVQERSPAHA